MDVPYIPSLDNNESIKGEKPVSGRKKKYHMLVYLFIAFAIVLCFYVSLAPKRINLKEGQWEIETRTMLPGESKEALVKTSQILTKTDYVPTFSISGSTCTMSQEWKVGSFVFVQVNCSNGTGRTQGDGYIRYKGDTISGSINMRTLDTDSMKRFKAYMNGRYSGN